MLDYEKTPHLISPGYGAGPSSTNHEEDTDGMEMAELPSKNKKRREERKTKRIYSPYVVMNSSQKNSISKSFVRMTCHESVSRDDKSPDSQPENDRSSNQKIPHCFIDSNRRKVDVDEKNTVNKTDVFQTDVITKFVKNASHTHVFDNIPSSFHNIPKIFPHNEHEKESLAHFLHVACFNNSFLKNFRYLKRGPQKIDFLLSNLAHNLSSQEIEKLGVTDLIGILENELTTFTCAKNIMI